jgi:hypothetical protein
MTTVDDLPLSGLLPSAAAAKHIAIVTSITTLAYLMTSVLDLLGGVGRQVYQDGEVPVHVAYALHVSEALGRVEATAMFSAPIVLILLLNLPPFKRFLAAAAGSIVVIGVPGAFRGFEQALWNAYVPRGPFEPSIPYYLAETGGGFVDSAFGAIYGALFIALSIYLVLLAVDRWTSLELLHHTR